MIVTIHQPEHLIWLGLVKKIDDADVFVILDSVQYRHGYVQNRNRIRTGSEQGWEWLTVPTVKHPLDTQIKDIEISYNVDWTKKYLNALRTNYGSAKYFKTYFPGIENIILKKHKMLVDLNIELIMFILKSFGISEKKILRSSEIDIGDAKGGSDVILGLCKQLGTKHYLAGPSGRDYLKLDDFEKEGIQVTFHEFHHPTYSQLHEPFMPGMSSIDMLFCHGQEVRDLLFLRSKNDTVSL